MNSNPLLSLGLTHLWQVTLVIVVVATLVRVFAKNRPHLAMALWLLVLAKCVTPPIVAVPFGLFCRTVVDEAEQVEPVEAAEAFAFFRRLNPSLAPAAAEVTYIEDSVPLVLTLEPEVPVRTMTAYDMLLLVWLGGAGGVAVISSVRVARCLRRLKRTQIETPPEIDTILQRLRSELGIRRRVSLIITSSGFGPAVIGLFRSRIVIPEIIASDNGADLEPILAHELIHIRRGDLWVGLLSLLTRSLWWFHPLVWWVSKQVARDTERACDEEVLAALNCRPADYARGLLRVLEKKNSLRAVPSFPGVRPVEITSQRMERIMSLRQGRRERSNWRLRLLVVLGAAVTLPGAVSSQDPAPKKKAEPAKPTVRIDTQLVRIPREELRQHLGLGTRVDVRQTALAVKVPVLGDLPVVGEWFTRRTLESSLVATDKPNMKIPATITLEGAAGPKLLADLKANQKADFLLAPSIVTGSGSNARLSTMDDGSDVTGFTLHVTPTVSDDEIDLVLKVEQTLKKPSENVPARSGKNVTRSQSRATLQPGQMLLQKVSEIDGEVTLLILSASKVQALGQLEPTPPAPTYLKQHSPDLAPAAVATSPPEKVVTRQLVTIRALIMEGERDAKIDFPNSVPMSKTPIVSTRKTSADGAGELLSPPQTALTYLLRTQPTAEFNPVNALSNQGWTVLSRPQIKTIIGLEAAIQIGQEVPDSNNGVWPQGIRLTLTPTEGQTGLNLSGKFSTRMTQDCTTIREFKDLSVTPGRTLMMKFAGTDTTKPYVLLLEASTTFPTRADAKVVQTSTHGSTTAEHLAKLKANLDAQRQAFIEDGALWDKVGPSPLGSFDNVAKASYRPPLLAGSPPEGGIVEQTSTFSEQLSQQLRQASYTEPSGLVTKSYDVAPLLTESIRASTAAAKQYLVKSNPTRAIPDKNTMFMMELQKNLRLSLGSDIWEAGKVDLYPKTLTLLVQQTPANHQKFEAALASMAESHQQHEKKIQREVRTYLVADLLNHSADQPEVVLPRLVKQLQEIVAPKAWKLGNDQMKPNQATRSLVVRTTAASHDQVRALLDLLRREMGLDGLIVRAYPVADLLVARPNGAAVPKQDVAMSQLKEMIQSTVSPQLWEGSGGKGMIQVSQNTLSLVIRSDGPSHRQIVELLTQLRSLRKNQVRLEVSIGDSPEPAATAGLFRANFMTAQEVKLGDNLVAGPPTTLFSGGTAKLSLTAETGAIPMKLTTIIGAKGTTLVKITVGTKIYSFPIPDGNTGIGDITEGARSALGEKANARRFTLVIKADVVAVQEEEELILHH